MELFERRLFGLNSAAEKPITGIITNEILKPTQLGVIANDANNLPLYYPAFIDFRNAQAFDGATLVAAELFINDQYAFTYLLVHPHTGVITKHVAWNINPGHNNVKIRVRDSYNQWSDFSNVLVYNLHFPDSPNYAFVGPEFFDDSNTDPNIFESMIKIYRWQNFKDVLYTGDSDVFLNFNFNTNPGSAQGVGSVVLTIYGNQAQAENFILPVNGSVPLGFQIPMDTGNINRRQMWDPTGVIGFKVQKINCVPGTTVNLMITAFDNQGTQYTKAKII